MIEKVNPSHPDKVADRIAGAIVDLAYAAEENPKMKSVVPSIWQPLKYWRWPGPKV